MFAAPFDCGSELVAPNIEPVAKKVASGGELTLHEDQLRDFLVCRAKLLGNLRVGAEKSVRIAT
jgi:hypothetical protein